MIIIKNSSEIELMRKSGELLAEVLLILEDAVRPGVSTYELDAIAEKFIVANGATPTSVNNELLHGIPSKKRILKEGDIISVDAGVNYKGLNTDAARTFAVGSVSEDVKRLMAVTEESFFRGLPFARTGYRLYDISARIQQHIERGGFQVVTDYVGHGVGRELHEDPNIPNYGDSLYCAHYENTVLITSDGPELLTLKD